MRKRMHETHGAQGCAAPRTDAAANRRRPSPAHSARFQVTLVILYIMTSCIDLFCFDRGFEAFRLMTIIITQHARRLENQHASKYARAHTHIHPRTRTHACTHAHTHTHTHTHAHARNLRIFRHQHPDAPAGDTKDLRHAPAHMYMCRQLRVHLWHRRGRRYQSVWPEVHALRVPGKQLDKLIDINAPAGPT